MFSIHINLPTAPNKLDFNGRSCGRPPKQRLCIFLIWPSHIKNPPNFEEEDRREAIQICVLNFATSGQCQWLFLRGCYWANVLLQNSCKLKCCTLARNPVQLWSEWSPLNLEVEKKIVRVLHTLAILFYVCLAKYILLCYNILS